MSRVRWVRRGNQFLGHRLVLQQLQLSYEANGEISGTWEDVETVDDGEPPARVGEVTQ